VIDALDTHSLAVEATQFVGVALRVSGPEGFEKRTRRVEIHAGVDRFAVTSYGALRVGQGSVDANDADSAPVETVTLRSTPARNRSR
jgi:hypothetical protein